MTCWMYPAGRQLPPAPGRFDPVVEGGAYRLPPELLRTLWDRACAEATDRAGLSDDAGARQRFHQLAALLVARGGQLRPDVGALTLVSPASSDALPDGWVRGARRPDTPGRETLVMTEARRWARSLGAPVPSASSDPTVHPTAIAAEYAFIPAGALPRREPHVTPIADRIHALLDRGPTFATASAVAVASRDGRRAYPPTIFRSQLAAGEPATSEDPALAEALRRRGGGEPLPHALRGELEAVLGADLGQARLHSDAIAGDAARAVRAHAFTVGVDIFFAPGAFDPRSAAGRALVAHELTHVVQAQQGRVAAAPAGQVRVSEPGDALEQEADRIARCFGTPATPLRAPVPSSLTPGQLDAAAHPPHSANVPPAARGPDSDVHHRATPTAIIESAPSPQPATALLRSPDPAAAAHAQVPAEGTRINEIGIVAWDGQPALRLRSTPSAADDNMVAALPFNARVQVLAQLPGDWLRVATLDGKTGYCARSHVWYAPEHALPEPGAQLHKVEPSKQGTAIHIAQRYYGAAADHWGSDLRFYVRVLGALNHVDVPDYASGWKAVRFHAGSYIWIPSVGFARSLHGALNSGSRSYELASTLGVSGVLQRVGELLGDIKDALWQSRRYIPEAVARHVEASMVAVVESLFQMAAGAVALLAISTAIGAAIGALAGGAGAAPGAAAGFEVGMALLEWIGLGFLVAWLGKAVVRIGTAFGAFFGAIWHARGDHQALDRAARAFAEALGTLAAAALEALVMWAMAVGVRAAVGKLQATRLGQQLGEGRIGAWLEQRIARYRAGDSPLPGPREVLRRLLEQRRRGERGDDQGEKPAQPTDAWSELAQHHSLDDVVTQILRLDQVDPATAGRLLAAGMNQFDLGEFSLQHGAEGMRAAAAMAQANIPPPVARRVLQVACDMGIERRSSTSSTLAGSRTSPAYGGSCSASPRN